MSTVVDFHSHILPGIDDGSQSVEESIEMLRMEVKQGIECIVATPHFYANYDSPDRFLKRRTEAEMQLRADLARYHGVPEIKIGAEVHFFYGMSNSDVLSELTIDQKKYILIEMPDSPWSTHMYQELENIYLKRGLTPVIAHVDRYISPFRTHSIPRRLEELPVMVQANASFFLRKSTQRLALRMLRSNQIHLLGSDCHNTSERAPNLGAALSVIEQQLGREFINRINFNERKILTHKITL